MRERRLNWKTSQPAKRQIFRRTLSASIPAYDPVSPKAAEFHARTEKIRLLLGGNQSGKSITTAYEVIKFCRSHPGCTAWACSGSFKMIGEALFPHYKSLLAPEEIQQLVWLNYAQRVPALIRLSNGSHIIFKSYDQGYYRFQSSRVDILQLDEQPPYVIFQECLARTAATGGQIIFSMTPLPGQNYVKTELWDKRGVSPYIWGERMSYRENRFISEEQKAILISLYGKDEIDRRVEGLFTTLSGLVFKEFDINVHVIPPFDIPVSWRKIRALDLGYSDPFVCLWLAQGDDNTLYLYQEYYKPHRLIVDHAETLKRMDYNGLATYHPHTRNDDIIEASVCDHDRQERAELDAVGIATIPADKADQALNIQRLNRRLKVRGNGKPGLYIFNTCLKTIEEWSNWKYKKEEKPEDGGDHTCDAGLYGNAFFEERHSDEPAAMGDRVFLDERYLEHEKIFDFF